MLNIFFFNVILLSRGRHFIFSSDTRYLQRVAGKILKREIPTRKMSPEISSPTYSLRPQEKSSHQQTLPKIVFLEDVRLVWLLWQTHAYLWTLILNMQWVINIWRAQILLVDESG